MARRVARLTEEAPIMVRDVEPADAAFIAHTWTRNYQSDASIPAKKKEPNLEAMNRDEINARLKRLSAEKSEYSASRVDVDIYWQEHRSLVASILQRDTARAKVAHYADDDKLLLGFVVYEVTDRPIVHYIYVKGIWRKARIGTKLVRNMKLEAGEGPYWASHWTRFSPVIKEGMGLAIEYNPYRSFKNELAKSSNGGADRAVIRDRGEEGLPLHQVAE